MSWNLSVQNDENLLEKYILSHSWILDSLMDWKQWKKNVYFNSE